MGEYDPLWRISETLFAQAMSWDTIQMKTKSIVDIMQKSQRTNGSNTNEISFRYVIVSVEDYFTMMTKMTMDMSYGEMNQISKWLKDIHTASVTSIKKEKDTSHSYDLRPISLRRRPTKRGWMQDAEGDYESRRKEVSGARGRHTIWSLLRKILLFKSSKCEVNIYCMTTFSIRDEMDLDQRIHVFKLEVRLVSRKNILSLEKNGSVSQVYK